MAGPVRQPIDQASLERYLEKNVPEIKTPLELKQFGFGQSNPTYQVTDSTGQRFVLRKKPPGKLLSKTAHRVDREYRVIHALENTDVPVPKAYCFCDDENVIGTDFYVMEFLDGRMIENPSLPGVSAEDRTAMWKDAIRTLAKLHRIRPKDVGLETFGKPTGFYDRQIKTFSQLAQSQAAAKDKETGQEVGLLPYFDDFVQFFSESSQQPQDRGALVHGDYKIDNLVWHKTEPKVIGILDWEISTVGHPLADVTNLIQPWTISNATTSWPRIHADRAFVDPSKSGSTNKDFPGLPTREQAVEWYCETAGFDIPDKDLTWAVSFALFRDSIIFQGIAARYAVRQASNAKAKQYGEERVPFAEMGKKMLEDAKAKKAGQSKL